MWPEPLSEPMSSHHGAQILEIVCSKYPIQENLFENVSYFVSTWLCLLIVCCHPRKGEFELKLQWRHDGLDGVSNHQTHDCLLNSLFRRIPKKTSKLHVLARGEFAADRWITLTNGQLRGKMFPFHDVIMYTCALKPRAICATGNEKVVIMRTFDFVCGNVFQLATRLAFSSHWNPLEAWVNLGLSDLRIWLC